jgi:hypothetical protein
MNLILWAYQLGMGVSGATPPPSGPATLREALYLKLSSIEDLATLTGGRIDFNARPQGDALPAVTHYVSSRSFDYDLSGPSGVSTATWRVDCWSKSELEAASMAGLVRRAFDGFHGTIGQVEILGCFLEDESDVPDFPRNGSDSYACRVELDFTVIHRA